MNDEQKAAIRRAADWLEANPDKHITCDLALDASGHATSPTGPEAVCFCALGRIAHEMGDVFPSPIPTFREIGAAAGLDRYAIHQIWRTNDENYTIYVSRKAAEAVEPVDIVLSNTTRAPVREANFQVIPLLLKLAA